MSDDPIKAALREAAKAFCICDGECFETRHGMMNGPCEAMLTQAAAAIEAFHRRMAEHWRGFAPDWQARHTQMADSVGRAAQEGGR